MRRYCIKYYGYHVHPKDNCIHWFLPTCYRFECKLCKCNTACTLSRTILTICCSHVSFISC